MLSHKRLGRLSVHPPGDFQLKLYMPFSSTACTCSSHNTVLDLIILSSAEEDSLITRFSYITVEYILIFMGLVAVARGFFFFTLLRYTNFCSYVASIDVRYDAGAGKWI